MKKLFITFIISLFVTPLTLADPTSELLEVFDSAGVNYSYSTSGTLIVLETKRTAEVIARIKSNVEAFGLTFDVVPYADSFEKAAAKRAKEERRNN